MASIACVEIVADETRDAVVEDLGNRAAANGHDRRATGERLDHHQAERLGPVDREQQRPGATEKRALLRLGDLAAVLDERMVQQRLDRAVSK